ncbi:hypothetical protein BJX61DRAFT_550830 [Aspergillus egyptiacus]|nr:hypothetical protein BJX61DRAFT_550830 [Aspergillus egyptiacus]
MRFWQSLLITLLSSTAASPQPEILTRDVCILGGGATGTYAAVQLVDRGYSVAVVEKEARLGGHAHTLHVPTGEWIDYGVGGYFNTTIVRDFFTQLEVPYEIPVQPTVVTTHVNFRTGETVPPPSPSDEATAALLRYEAAVQQFAFLSTGIYDLPDPVPEVLLRPFREFVHTYDLQAALQVIRVWSKPVGDLLEAPALYLIQDFGISHFNGLRQGPGIRPVNGTEALFRSAARYLDETDNNILYQTTVTQATRSSRGVELIVQGANGSRTLIRAKKLLIAFPPLLSSLKGFDLTPEEGSLFSQWSYTAYYAAAINNSGIPDGLSLINTNPTNAPGSLPVLPFQFGIDYSGVPGLFLTRLVGASNFTAEDARQLILDDLMRMRETGTFPIHDKPEIIAFVIHTPEALTVPVDSVRNGFYRRVYGLQGQQSTYYTGYAFCTDYTPQLWDYTLGVVDMMVRELG